MKAYVSSVVLGALLAVSAVAGVPGGTDGAVKFKVTTKPTPEKYAPRHCIAIWVTDSQGNFVKTLEVRARAYMKHLTRWTKSSKSNKVDAITGATLRKHEVHTLVWNCRDSKGALVPDGEYQIHVEFTEKNGPGPVTPDGHIKFTKGPAEVPLTPGNLPYFTDMKLQYLPQAKPAAPKTE